MNYANYETNISKKLPFCNEKSILPKTLPFSKCLLPKIRQILVMFSVKHLATLLLLTTVSQL